MAANMSWCSDRASQRRRPGRTSWPPIVRLPRVGIGLGLHLVENSRENQLTPWSNDPVADPASEAVYIRDDETGELWGPTAAPIRAAGSTYLARHGAGYSRFEHVHNGIALDLVQFVPPDDRLKVGVLTIENRSGRRRRLSVAVYAEWVLGTSRGSAAPTIITELEPETRAVLARNPWNPDFGSRVAFLDLGGRQDAWTADRTEFLGRNGAADRPAGMERGHRLGAASDAGLDPCAVLQTSFELAAGERTDVRILLGQADSRTAVVELIGRGRMLDHAATLRAIATYWDDTLGTVKVRTPDRSMDILLNRWLLYQAQACRLWARTAFYQAGGAYGFRDQLQDVIGLTISNRPLVREHLLRAAAHQFPEGDVQHWWHPPSGRGVRTRISDDRLWLPYAVDRYVAITGDAGIFDEPIPFIDGPGLRPDQDDACSSRALLQDTASLCALRSSDRREPGGRHPRAAADPGPATGTMA
jgi:cyclic beta-1,2-glucan synthetase